MYRTICATMFVALMLAASPSLALHCSGTVTTIDGGDESIHLDQRSGPAGELVLYVYLESNDVPGLQSGADWLYCNGNPEPECIPHNLLFADPCGHADPDILLVRVPAGVP